MPSLVYLDNHINIHEYFPNARWDSQYSKYRFTIEDEYPFTAYVLVDRHDRIQKDVRKYIERYGHDDVLYYSIDKSYSYCWNFDSVKSTWDQKWDKIHHKYWQFSFGDEKDLTMLMLKYSNTFFLEMHEFHPDYDYHNELNTRKW